MWFAGMIVIAGSPVKLIGRTFNYSYDNMKIIPRIWINECYGPSFRYQSIVIRCGLLYFGIQIKHP